MNTILKIIGIVLINLSLIFFALLIQEGSTEKISRSTDTPSGNGLETAIFTIILLIGILIFFISKKIRPYLIGIIALSISSVIFFVFYTNKSFATSGKFETFKLRNANWTDKNFYLNIAFNSWYNSTEVTVDKCLQVDSVQVRVDKGLWGMRTMSDEIKIAENFNCKYNDLDSMNLPQNKMELGDSLAKKRCFQSAIEQYTKCITIDSSSAEAYNNRGLIYMVTKKYDNALNDFISSAMLKYSQSSPKTKKTIGNSELIKYSKELLKSLTNNKSGDIEKYIKNINGINDYSTYKKRIQYCVEKIMH